MQKKWQKRGNWYKRIKNNLKAKLYDQFNLIGTQSRLQKCQWRVTVPIKKIFASGQ